MNWNSRLAFMSTQVYLSKHTYQTTHEEETPVYSRIQLSRATVKELHSRLQQAYQRDDVRLGSVLDVEMTILDKQSKGVPIDE
jgi:hypothetical protein